MPRKPAKQPTTRRRSATTRPSPAPSSRDVHWLEGVFMHSALGIARLDRDARVVDANSAFQCFVGYDIAGLTGRALREFAVAEDVEAIIAIIAEVGSGHASSAVREVRFVRDDATVAWGSIMLTRAGERRGAGLVALLQDISARKALETDLLHKAFHDALTGLANRAMFRDRLDHAIDRAAREPERIGLLFIDLDDFKTINDTQGHAAGDRVLQRVAAVLLNSIRGCDTVCRLGGDEFAILIERLNHEEGPDVAAQRIVNALARPIETEPGRHVTVTASIGIAVRKHGESRDDLLRNADVALYEAKKRSRGRWVTYDPAMHAALVDKATLEADLRVAIERCQLSHRPGLEKTGRFPRFAPSPSPAQITVAYQPIVDIVSSRMTGVEALLRWTHPERGTIAPSVFVPVAEESGLVLALGRWVLRTACHQAAAWNRGCADDRLSITVNVSARQLQDPALTLDVQAALEESGLEPQRLVLEMTESVIMNEATAARARLHDLKALGVRLAIDDFGTGYSSLSHLQQFPVDILKIDRSFLQKMHQGSHGAALVRTIITLAKLLSLRTIAEGVEDSEQQQQLRELGCDCAQGFLFGRPMTVEELAPLLSSGGFSRVAITHAE